jgi:hypothetical protein
MIWDMYLLSKVFETVSLEKKRISVTQPHQDLGSNLAKGSGGSVVVVRRSCFEESTLGCIAAYQKRDHQVGVGDVAEGERRLDIP